MTVGVRRIEKLMTTENKFADLGIVDSVATLSVIAKIAASATKGTAVWWRGHSSSNWKLVPNVFRGNATQILEREKNLALRFMMKAGTRHAKCPDNSDTPGWLFLMQHYGLPTRLLDWSESILVATYFAATEHLDVDGTIWALLPFHLNLNQIGSGKVPLPGNEEVMPLILAALGRSEFKSDKVVAVYPIEADVRMLMQHGAYTIHSSNTPLEDYHSPIQFLCRATIPANAKLALAEELRNLGVRRSTLFPDLHNLALDLRESK